MWILRRNFRRKITDFFFDEVEDDIEVKAEEQTKQQKKEVKMTYEYPKERSFRFPVIPDYDIETINRKSRPIIRQDHAKHFRKRRPNMNVFKHKSSSIRGYQGYHLKKTEREMDDIPAFMRRKETQREEIAATTPHDQDRRHIRYSKPDELDAVFQKKNRTFSEKQFPKDSFERPAYERRSERPGTQLNKASITANRHRKNDQKQVNESFNRHDTTVQQHKRNEEKRHETPSPILHDALPAKRDEQHTGQMELPNHLLDDAIQPTTDDTEWLIEQQILLEETLEHFNIDATVVNVTQGPSVTRFEIQPALGVRVNKIRNLADDIKLNMAAKDIRIEAPIPGKNTIGIEIPNQFSQIVCIQEIIETDDFHMNRSPLTIALGLTIEGEPLITNIEKMPHGLIAGATGSGKSVCINSILLSLLYKASYDEVKLLLIDPKMVELAPYNGIPHLISPVITDAKAATMALKWAVKEMDERYNQLAEARVRNIKAYNEKMKNEHRVADKMPYIVIVIDELADLMMISPQDVEDAICRIAQKARACGIHLLIATQRPSVDVITGLIKANIPTRIAFSVSSQVDSRTIIDTVGAEKLLGKGDMLFVENGANKHLRLQGPFVSDEEIDRVTNHLRTIAKPNYLFEEEQLLLDIEAEEKDEYLQEAISLVLEENQASTSLLQRRFRIGYNRAARLIDTLEAKGIISGPNGSKPRDVLVSTSQIEQFLSN